MYIEDLKGRITYNTDLQDLYLKKLIKNPDIIRHFENSQKQHKKLKFLVARQWNSWYPSYFHSEGGCYAITTRDSESDPHKNSGVIVIDPGFGFMVSLRKHFHIEPQDIKKIFISHFHPDHMAGLIEFATLSYESEYPCDVFLNSTSYSFFKAFQGKYLHIHEIKSGQIKRLFQYDYKSTLYPEHIITESAFIKMVDTHHSEIGHRHNSLGFIFDFQQSFKKDPSKKFNQKIGILGDTDGNKQYIPEYLRNFSDVDILFLHLGSINSKKFEIGDAHLYLDGVEDILGQMNLKQNNTNPKLVLLSEFGLELGTTKDIVKLLSPLLESHGFSLFLCQTSILNNNENYFEKEVSAHLIDKIWITLHQKAKTELSYKEIEEIICTLALFSLSTSRIDSFELIKTGNEESKLQLKKQIKRNFSQLFCNVIQLLNISDPNEYFKQIRNTSKLLYPKCQEFMKELPKKKNKDNIKKLYLNLCNHSACRNVLLTTKEKEILCNYEQLESELSKNRNRELNYELDDEISDILSINEKIINLNIEHIWILAENTLSGLMELRFSKNYMNQIPINNKRSDIILKELSKYFDKNNIPTQCANAGSSITLFENAYRGDTKISFRFIDENGNEKSFKTN